MAKVLEFLNGKKTYLCLFAGGLIQTAVLGGYITQEQASPFLIMLGFGAAASGRAAIK